MAFKLVILGDSHFAGRAGSAQTFTAGGHTGRMLKSDGWHTIADPTGYYDVSGNGSYWPLFATYYCADQAADIDIINAAVGSTGLTNGATTNWPKGGSLYTQMVTAITASGWSVVDAFLISGWGNDTAAGATPSFATEATAINLLISNLQSDYPGAMVFHQQMGSFTSSDRATADNIRKAINSSSALFGGAVYDIDPTTFGDGLHITTDTGVARVAKRLWLAVREGFFGSTLYSGQGPTVLSCTINAGLTQTTITYGLASTPLLPASASSPWAGYRIMDNGSSVTISDVTQVGNTHVITHTAIVGTPTLSLGSWYDGMGVAVPSDSSSNLIPARALVEIAVVPFSAPPAGVGIPRSRMQLCM